MKENFTVLIRKKAEGEKTRQVLNAEVKLKLKELQYSDFNYFVLCMATYYCFLRRTELTKLKVKDINLSDGYISIDGSQSKNKKNESITIPDAFSLILAKHIDKSSSENYLFSDDNFRPGKISLNPKKISDTWSKFRKRNNIESMYQFYSLKDTGITDLLNLGVPAIKVRDQARHYDIKITEKYTPRNKASDEVVRNANFSF